jgi:hypothetical protein
MPGFTLNAFGPRFASVAFAELAQGRARLAIYHSLGHPNWRR